MYTYVQLHTYEQLQDGQWSGVVKIEYSNGDVYQGELRHDIPHGKGVWTESTGAVYEVRLPYSTYAPRLWLVSQNLCKPESGV